MKDDELSYIINIEYPKQISLHDKIAEQYFLGSDDEKPRITQIWRRAMNLKDEKNGI